MVTRTRLALGTLAFLYIAASSSVSVAGADLPMRFTLNDSAPHGMHWLASTPALAAAPIARRVDIVSGRLVVKYRPSVDACAHCLFARGRAFATVTGNDSLDRLHTDLGVRSIRPVFFERHDLDRARARAAFERHVDDVRLRYPQRCARAGLHPQVPDLTGVYELEIDEDLDPVVAAQHYAGSADVVWAEPLRRSHATFIPNDPFLATSNSWGQGYADLWGMFAIDAPAAWDTAAGTGSVVAIIDTGVDPAHPDIGANLWTNAGEIPGNGADDDANGYVDDVNGWDFIDDDNDPLDRHGHGTHVAGTAAAAGNDAFGVAGVAYQAEIMPLKGLSDSGSGPDSELAEAIMYAADNGADVINNSWGGFGLSQVLYDALSYAAALGVVIASASGNEAREITSLLWLPHGHPDGLTVGAIDPSGALASFSNYGPFQSIATPGVDTLSTRSSKHIFGSSSEVAGQWLRLSGTSMASPHAAGAAAVLLSAQPMLTAAEVRWQLELNAVQPPGFQGALHNPFYGFGVLDAGAMFSPAPVTLRLTPPGQTWWHAFSESRPVPGKAARFLFTSLAPQSWSITTFAPLVAVSPNGTGSANAPLQIDATATPVGTYDGEVRVDAPSALNTGERFTARVSVHSDQRAGPPTVVGTNGRGTILGFSPSIAGSATTTLVAWQGEDTEFGLQLALIDGANNVVGPIAVGPAAISDITVASDGNDFIVAWRDFGGDNEGVHFIRVAADGTLQDTEPVRAVTRRQKRFCRFLDLNGIDFDGEDYWLAYSDVNLCGKEKTKLHAVRVHRDGTVAKPERTAKIRSRVLPVFACRKPDCLFAWWDLTAESIEPVTGKFIRAGFALPVFQGKAAGPPQRIVTDLAGFAALASDGTDYMALLRRDVLCAAGDFCRTEVRGVRIDGDTGAPLDPDPFLVSNIAPAERVFPWTGGLTYDGSDFVATYQIQAVDDSPFDDGNYVFANRISTNGVPQASEDVGLLVDSSGRSAFSRIATTASGTIIVYENGDGDPLEEPYPHPDFRRHIVQRMFPHEPDSSLYPISEIGTIGDRSIPERGYLRFRVTASALDPATAVYAASGLPGGAVFDPTSRIFHWSPDGTAAGTYPGVTFSASDGATNVSETITITVTQTISSATGIAQFADGSPAAGVALDVRGTADKTRTVFTDGDGSYSIEETVPGKRMRIRVGRASKKQFTSNPKALSVEATPGDVTLPVLTVIPR